MKDTKESVYHGAIISALAIGYTMLGKTLIKMSPPSLSKFDIEDSVKLVGIVAMSDFTKDYLIKQKIIHNNICARSNFWGVVRVRGQGWG